METPARTTLAGPRLHRRRLVRAGDGTHLRRHVDRARAASISSPSRGAFIRRDVGGRERPHHRRRTRAAPAPSTTSAGTAAPACATPIAVRSPAASSARITRWTYDLRWPADRGAADGRGRRLRPRRLSAASGRLRRSGTAMSSSTWRRRRAPLGEQLGDLPARFAPWRMGELRMVRRVEYDVRANWKLIVQNYNECLHCPIIHPLLNRMHHYLGAANVPVDRHLLRRRDGIQRRRRDAERRRQAPPRACSPAWGRERAARSSTTSRSTRTCC